MNWYALYVKTGEEETVKKYIARHLSKDIKSCIVPKRMIPEKKHGEFFNVVRPLFPGYVLFQTQLTAKLYYAIRDVPKVIYVVFGGEYKKDKSVSNFSPISQDEINWLLNLFSGEEILEYSDVVKLDTKVKVISGPLKDREAIIKKIDIRKHRAKIELNFLGDTRLLDVGINIIEWR